MYYIKPHIVCRSSNGRRCAPLREAMVVVTAADFKSAYDRMCDVSAECGGGLSLLILLPPSPDAMAAARILTVSPPSCSLPAHLLSHAISPPFPRVCGCVRVFWACGSHGIDWCRQRGAIRPRWRVMGCVRVRGTARQHTVPCLPPFHTLFHCVCFIKCRIFSV